MINIIIESNKNEQYFAGGRGWKKINKALYQGGKN